MNYFSEIVDILGACVDASGVGAIIIGSVLSTFTYITHLRNPDLAPTAYHKYRIGLARAILLGLEFLVAADIIRTVALSPTFTSVGILAIIVLIRTFLSVTLEADITGSMPWSRAKQPENQQH